MPQQTDAPAIEGEELSFTHVGADAKAPPGRNDGWAVGDAGAPPRGGGPPLNSDYQASLGEWSLPVDPTGLARAAHLIHVRSAMVAARSAAVSSIEP
jgi:hypothetical protein